MKKQTFELDIVTTTYLNNALLAVTTNGYFLEDLFDLAESDEDFMDKEIENIKFDVIDMPKITISIERYYEGEEVIK